MAYVVRKALITGKCHLLPWGERWFAEKQAWTEIKNNKQKKGVEMRKKLLLGLVALSTAVFGAQAINVELALVIDQSGSISAADFATQKAAYIAAITSEVPTDGSVAIGVWKFGSSVQSVFATTVIDATEKANLLAAITAMTQTGGSTALGPAIQTAANDLLGNSITSTKQIIDVSTDGFGNVGISGAAATTAALAGGIEQVNGLLIGGGADGSFVGGTGSFAISATFANVDAALTAKLRREITGVPEAGSSIALMLLGIAGLAGLRRLRTA